MLQRKNVSGLGFTLVEIMIVVAVIALLAAISIPGFLRARKRTQATRVINDLRSIDSAIDQYALENSRMAGTTVPVAAWTSYVKPGTLLHRTGQDVFGNSYGVQTVDLIPIVPANTYLALSDVANSAFFSPYSR